MSGITTRIRKHLMQIDPHCWWCGLYLIEIDDIANRGAESTLDHLNTRNTPTGERRPSKPGQIEYVLACKPCNTIRGRISMALFQAGLIRSNEVTIQEAIEIQQRYPETRESFEIGDTVRVRLRTGTILSGVYVITRHLRKFDTWIIKNEVTDYETYSRTRYLVKIKDTKA